MLGPFKGILRGLVQIHRASCRKLCQASSLGLEKSNLDLEINRLVWIDMEMTGLDVNTCKIMEIACIVTDASLNIVAEGPDLIIHQPEEILSNMNEWCIKQHGKTGLTDACLKSTVSEKDAENIIYKFLSDNVSENVSPLAGNSVYMDRYFLRQYMPKIDQYLHYRILDVSTIKELCRRWNKELFSTLPKKEYTHRALNDIRESIEELKFYRENFLKTS